MPSHQGYLPREMCHPTGIAAARQWNYLPWAVCATSTDCKLHLPRPREPRPQAGRQGHLTETISPGRDLGPLPGPPGPSHRGCRPLADLAGREHPAFARVLCSKRSQRGLWTPAPASSASESAELSDRRLPPVSMVSSSTPREGLPAGPCAVAPPAGSAPRRPLRRRPLPGGSREKGGRSFPTCVKLPPPH